MNYTCALEVVHVCRSDPDMVAAPVKPFHANPQMSYSQVENPEEVLKIELKFRKSFILFRSSTTPSTCNGHCFQHLDRVGSKWRKWTAATQTICRWHDVLHQWLRRRKFRSKICRDRWKVVEPALPDQENFIWIWNRLKKMKETRYVLSRVIDC